MKKLKILFPLLAVMALCSCSNNTSSSSLSPSSSSSATSSNTSTSSVLNGYFEREDEEGNLYKGNFVNGEYDGKVAVKLLGILVVYISAKLMMVQCMA